MNETYFFQSSGQNARTLSADAITSMSVTLTKISEQQSASGAEPGEALVKQPFCGFIFKNSSGIYIFRQNFRIKRITNFNILE